jgi:hypothetical protein
MQMEDDGELEKMIEDVLKANETLKRDPSNQVQYVKNLLSRNWFQVKNSDAVFAIGKMINMKLIDGGTGWAVQMAIDSKKQIFVFDQKFNRWNKFNYNKMEFDRFCEVPTLTENFAGIGTREINPWGVAAIQQIYKENII